MECVVQVVPGIQLFIVIVATLHLLSCGIELRWGLNKLTPIERRRFSPLQLTAGCADSAVGAALRISRSTASS